MTARWRPWLPWLAMMVVLGVALVVAASSGPGSSSEPARVARITSEIRCPTCRGLSAAESDAKTAAAIRDEVTRQVHGGQTDGQILAFMRDHYGADILLRPPASGFDGLVWALPVVGFILAGAGLAVAFRRWSGAAGVPVADADRSRVARELGEPT